MANVVPESICPTTGKYKYPSEGAAKAALRGQKTRKRNRVGRLKPGQVNSTYLCSGCNQWHIGRKMG